MTEDHTQSQLQEEETDVKLFLKPSQDQEFRDWMRDNSNGFYLNERKKWFVTNRKGTAMMHKVSCKHLMDSQNQCTTSSGKAAHPLQERLIHWAITNDNTISLCKTCKP